MQCGSRLSHTSTAKEHTIKPHLFAALGATAIASASHIGDMCLDVRGVYRAACTLSGRVKKRASPTERVLARVCREAGACVPFDAFLRDMNVGVAAGDGRRTEVLAQDLPCFGGTQLAVDIT